MTRIIECEQVVKRYRRGSFFRKGEDITAVAKVSFQVQEGSIVGLIGPSGSGKSTLSRMILGLEHPEEGHVRFRGRDMRGFEREDWRRFRRDVQAVFQNALGSINPRFTAGEAIAEPLLNFERPGAGALKERIAELLRMVGLQPDDMAKLPHQFSGGQLQRICIARSLALRPSLIVLDEAVSSLDMITQARILDLLKGIQRDTGVAFLLITHDIRLVKGFCDTVAVMDEGRITAWFENLDGLVSSEDPTLNRLFDAVLPPLPKGCLGYQSARDPEPTDQEGMRSDSEPVLCGL
jgi:nickel transport system ATP-binding protein